MGSSKLAAILILLTCLQTSLIAYSQHLPHLSITEKNETLEKVLKDIRKKTGYTYFGDVAWLQQARRVTISVTDASIREVLDICFKDQPLSYELVGTAISIQPKEQPLILIQGWVINEKKEPIPGATVMVKGSNKAEYTSTASNDSGEFRLRVTDPNASLVFSCINYEQQELSLLGVRNVTVQLKAKISELVDVVISNGYQYIPKDRATGSFVKLNNTTISRRVSTSILDRMDGVTSSMIFNKNPIAGNPNNQSIITIRGRSTIFANPDPLIVIDNFPYSGDINNINPDDVESITVLKDAAAASIWGAFSGNGVIVITTKKGKYNQAPKLSFNTSLTIGAKPDLYYLPILPSHDYVDVEQYLFGQQYYASREASPEHFALSPAVEIMIQGRDKLIDSTLETNMLNSLRMQDTRQDLNKYFYRTSLNQQYSLSLSGGSSHNQYYLSGGFDRNQTNLVRNSYSRVTLNGNNTYNIVPNKLELVTGFTFTSSTTTNNNTGFINSNLPYLKLADANGNAIAIPNLLRLGYVDTAGGGQLLDWHYRPLDELRNADISTRLRDYRINIGLRYTILKDLDARINYQYGNGSSDFQNYKSLQTYYTRNLINEFTQVDSLGNLSWPVPMGGILDETVTGYQANNVRVQLSYDHLLNPEQRLTAIAGWELRDVEGQMKMTRQYGYDKDLQNNLPLDYITPYAQYSSQGITNKIPYLNQSSATSDRYISYFFNGSYTYKKRYILSGSARRDESNLFGVHANQKGVPLWSIGGAWDISKESFYQVGWLPFLKLRVTDGYNGNVDRSVSAYTTALSNPQGNSYGAASASIINPPNPNLRWERINIINTGLDFGTRDGRLDGSLEYYVKTGKDLIGQSPVDPTTGVSTFTGNTANMVTHGIDLVLHTKHSFGAIRWNTAFLFNYVRDKVTDYKEQLSSIRNYFNSSLINPLVGRPLYSVYALQWMGLDPQNGDPQGWLNGHITKAYSAIFNSSDFSNLLYKGPANPPVFGSLLNSFYWKQWGVSFNIIYKFGYYFRRSSVNYSDLFSGNSPGHPDYEHRWQKTGDEKYTNIPSMTYPASFDRDFFYGDAEVLIEKGDHIRLQDLQVSYDLSKNDFSKLPVKSIRFYLYANNIGILWKANHQGVDPDNINSTPNPRTLAIGLKMDL